MPVIQNCSRLMKHLSRILIDISSMLGIPRDSLGILACSKGVWAGSISYTTGQTQIDCSHSQLAFEVLPQAQFLCLVDGDPHGMEILSVYKHGQQQQDYSHQKSASKISRKKIMKKCLHDVDILDISWLQCRLPL